MPFDSGFGHTIGDARKAQTAASSPAVQRQWYGGPPPTPSESAIIAAFIDSLPADVFSPHVVGQLREWHEEWTPGSQATEVQADLASGGVAHVGQRPPLTPGPVVGDEAEALTNEERAFFRGVGISPHHMSKWLAGRLAAARAEALREAADEVHIEARWQAEQKARFAGIPTTHDYVLERLVVLETILTDRAASLARTGTEDQGVKSDG